MITLRQGVFETNSSSDHVLVFQKQKPDLKPKKEDIGFWAFFHEDGTSIEEGEKEGYLKIHLKDYDRGPEICRTLHEKLDYIASLILHGTDNSIRDDGYFAYGDHTFGTPPIEDNIPPKEWRAWLSDKEKLESDPEWQEVVECVKKNVPGCLGIIVEPSSSWVESDRSLQGIIDGGGVTLEQMLFCEDVILLIDTDEH